MRLRELEVTDFRGIRQASITFGPGLNVLHGPNDLGKSTLAEAVRAALLVPTKSQDGKSYVPWGSDLPARVTLVFEEAGKVWRVRKTFGSSAQAFLEQADPAEGTAALKFREVVKGNGVEGKLREILSWGIAAPGGKGKPAKPVSYLVTALLGRQGEVQGIFDCSLAGDNDDNGKALVTSALGAMASDPVVAQIVDRLTVRIESVFTAGGKFKQTADSPLVQRQQHLKEQEATLQRLKDEDFKGKLIEKKVVELQEERERLAEEAELAKSTLANAVEADQQKRKRTTLQAVAHELRQKLASADLLECEVQSLGEKAAEKKAQQSRLNAERLASVSVLESTQSELASAKERVAKLTAEASQAVNIAEATRAQRRAELQAQLTASQARVAEIESAEKILTESEKLARDLSEANGTAAQASEAVVAAESALERASTTAELHELTQRQKEADRLKIASDLASQRQEEARQGLDGAEASLMEATSRRDSGQFTADSDEFGRLTSELTALGRADLRIRIQTARARVEQLRDEAARQKDLLASAADKRASASRIEQDLANRVLPTKEQIASWQVLEKEVADTATAQPPDSPVAIPLVSGLVLGAISGLVSRLILSTSWGVAALAAAVVALIAATVIWSVVGRRARLVTEERAGHRRQLLERWNAEVQPGLRSAGLSTLAAYEGAVAAVAAKRSEAQRMREAAVREEEVAAVAAVAAAPLAALEAESSRLESEDDGVADPAQDALLDRFANDHSGLRDHLRDVQKQLDALMATLRAAAEEAVRTAALEVGVKRSALDAAVDEAAGARVLFEHAVQQCDQARHGELSALLASMGPVEDVESAAVNDARAEVDQRKLAASEASATAAALQRQLEALTPKVNQLAGGRDLAREREAVEREVADIQGEISALQSPAEDVMVCGADALSKAKQLLAVLQDREGAQKATVEAATKALVEIERAVAELESQVSSKRGELKGIDRAALEAKLSATLADPVFGMTLPEAVDVPAATANRDTATKRLKECEARLHEAKGQLTLVAGHVGAERLARQEEAVRYAREEVLDREETERAALRLLNEIKAVEAERASHLGRVLAGPISETFRTLTGGRYDQIRFDQDLKTEDIAAVGERRAITDLSVGTREQLATLIRLAVAANLRTAVILDDQLVHSDSDRLAWFRTRLRDAIRDFDHQVIVFTCRRTDYCQADATVEAGVTVIDLGALLTASAGVVSQGGPAYA